MHACSGLYLSVVGCLLFGIGNANALLLNSEFVERKNSQKTGLTDPNRFDFDLAPNIDGTDSFHSDIADSAAGPLPSQVGRAFSADPSADTNIKLVNQDQTIVGDGLTVLNLKNFVLKDGTITLQGTASTTFVINVSNRFSLRNAAQIVLSGGLEYASVTFNVLSRGDRVRISNDSSLIGTINALDRTVRVGGESSVIGIVNAKQIRLVSGGVIIPPVVSP